MNIQFKIGDLFNNPTVQDVIKAIEREELCLHVSYAQLFLNDTNETSTTGCIVIHPTTKLINLLTDNKLFYIPFMKSQRDPFYIQYQKTLSPLLTLNTTSFDFGVFIEQFSYLPRFTLQSGVLIFNLQDRKEITFIFTLESIMYKFCYKIKDFDGCIKYTTDNNGEIGLYLSVSITPRMYKLDPLANIHTYSDTSGWDRLASNVIGDTGISSHLNICSTFESPAFCQYVGRCLDHRITITLLRPDETDDPNDVTIDDTFTILRQFGLLTMESEIDVKVCDSLKIIPYDTSKLDRLSFPVLFQIQSLLSNNTINEFSLNQDSVDIISSLDPEFAESMLMLIRNRRKRTFDFLSLIQFYQNEERQVNDQIMSMQNQGVNHNHVRRVVITPTKMYLSGPHIEISNRILRTYESSIKQFLRVTFTDDDFQLVGNSETHTQLHQRIEGFLEHSISIGLHDFSFLHYSNSQLRSQGCWFFENGSVTVQQIRSSMGDFSSMTNPAKHGSRMAQCFSSTTLTGRLDSTNIIQIPDVERNGYCFSDGVGKIGLLIAQNVTRCLNKSSSLSTVDPSAFQFRMAGCKGILCVDPTIPGDQIHIRPSQIKFDSSTFALEICRSSFYSPGFLNRQNIAILESLGVEKQIFVDLKDEMIADLKLILLDQDIALSILRSSEDTYGVSEILINLILEGFFVMRDPFLVNMLQMFSLLQMRDLKLKTKIHIKKSCTLLGVMDETGLLEEGCIFFQYIDPCSKVTNSMTVLFILNQLLRKGHVLLTRNPALHAGDIQRVTSVDVNDYPALGHLKDVIVFSQHGQQPLPHKLAGGDLDGDTFFVCWDERLLIDENVASLDYDKLETDIAPSLSIEQGVTIHDIKCHFGNNLGQIANAWLATVDMEENGALSQRAIQLSKMHSFAVDFPKRGIPAVFDKELMPKAYPDFMEIHSKKTYNSKKAIGVIYQSISSEKVCIRIDSEFISQSRFVLNESCLFMDEALEIYRAYSAEINAMMRQYSIGDEYELLSGYFVEVKEISSKRNQHELKNQLMGDVMRLRLKYRATFFNSPLPTSLQVNDFIAHDVQEFPFISRYSDPLSTACFSLVSDYLFRKRDIKSQRFKIYRA